MTVEQIAEVRAQYLVDASSSSVPVGYKKTEAGIIPDDWIATTIGDVTAWLSGGTPSRERLDFWQGNIPWISGSTLKTLEISTSDQHLTFEGVNAGSKMAPLNSTLMLVRGSALHSEIRAGLVVERVCFNQDVKALIPKPDVLPKFLTIYILAMESELLKLVSSAGNSAGVLDTELVKKFKFLKPSISEQTAIANALSDVDALIQELEKLIAKKQAIKTATMQQLLTGRTRLPQFAHHPDGRKKGYKPSELGEIPEDWEVLVYGDVFTFLSTSTNSRADLSDSGDYGYIHYGDIHTKWNNKLDLSKSTIPRISSELVNSDFIENGDIIMADASEDYAGIGKSVEVINVHANKVVAGLHTFLLRDKSKVYVDGFRGYLHCIPAVKTTFDRLATGMKVYGISKNNLFVVPIPVPPREEQVSITSMLSEMDLEIQALDQRLNKTRQIKQGMMQELLTGKTRLVKPAEPA
jgi:type I restriction enzyme S subunit